MSKDEIQTAYQKYVEVNERIKALKDEIKPLEKELAIHEAMLMKGIKRGETKNGITHTFIERRNPKYKDILQQVRERFVPKTKQAECDVIVGELTTITYTDKFEVVG